MNKFETEKEKEPLKKTTGTVADTVGSVSASAGAGASNPLEDFLATFPGYAGDPGQESHEEGIIEHWFTILDEFNSKKASNTLFDDMELDPAWLQMKDVHLQSDATPLAADATAGQNMLSVPAAVFPLVHDLQMAIGFLEQRAHAAWIGGLEKRTRHMLGGRMEATLQTMGRALAEAMTALCASENLQATDIAALQQHAQGEGVNVLAGDVLKLLSLKDVVRLVDAGGRDETDRLFTAPLPPKEELQTRLTQVLGRQLLATAETSTALQHGLKGITDKRIREYFLSRHASLGESVASLQHARDKSVRLREAVKANVKINLDEHALRWTVHRGKTPAGIARRAKLKDLIAPLMQTLEQCETTLERAINGITLTRANALKTVAHLTGEKIADSTVANYFRKKLTGLGHAVSAVGPYLGGPDRMIDDLFQPETPVPGADSSLTAAVSSELTTLMMPLDNAVAQVLSLSKPLQREAEKLERVLKRDRVSDIDPRRLQREGELMLALPRLRGPALAEKVFGTVLAGALNRDPGDERREEKVKQAEETVTSLTGAILRLLPHLTLQLGEGLRPAGEALYEKHADAPHTTAFINQTGQLAKAFSAALTKFGQATARAVAAGHTPQAAAELAKAAGKITLLAEQLSKDIRRYSSRHLGSGYRYKSHDKKMVQALLTLALELAGGKPDRERAMVSHLQSLLSDPHRTLLQRDKDPENRLLTAGLEQAYQDHRNQISLPQAPSAEALLEQIPGMMDAIHGKAVTKTIQALVNMALAGGMGADVVADLALSATDALDPTGRMARPGQALRGYQAYSAYKVMKKLGASAQPGKRPPDYHYNKAQNRQGVEMGLAMTSFIPSPFLLPVTLPLALHAAITKPELFVKKAADTLPLDVAISGGFQGARAGGRIGTALGRMLQKRRLAELLRAWQEAEGSSTPLTEEQMEAILAEVQAQGAGVQSDEPRTRRKRAAPDTPDLLGAEDSVAALSKRWNIPISPTMQVDVYQANPEFGVTKMDLKSALENKEGNVLYIRAAFHDKAYINEALNRECNAYLASHAHQEKMPFIARQMPPDQWLTYLQFKYTGLAEAGTALSSEMHIIIHYPDGEEKSVTLATALRAPAGSHVVMASGFTAALMDDINLYIENNQEGAPLPEDLMRQRDAHYFHRTMQFYEKKGGDIAHLNQLIKSGELPESARRFWDTIKTLKAETAQQLAGKQSFQEIVNYYNKEINAKLRTFVPSATYEDNQDIANQIAFLKNEKEVFVSLRKGFGEAIKFLKAHPVTFSDHPLVRFEQSLVVAFKMKFPGETADLSDKQIYEKAALMIANKNSDRASIQSLTNMHQFVYYIGSHKHEWKGDDSDIQSSNLFYGHVFSSTKKGISVREVSNQFTDATKSPAADYKSLTNHKGIAEYWDQTDYQFYQQFEGYKALHAENEAIDDIHHLSIQSGIAPSDQYEAPVAYKTFKVQIPVAEIRYSEPLTTIKDQFNHYTTAIGSVTLFQTKSGDYWSLCTVNNDKHLIKIDKATFDQYSTTSELNDEAAVKEFYKKTGVQLAVLQTPKTTSMVNSYLEQTDNITFFFYHLGRKMGGHAPKNLIPTFDIEQRYYKVTSSAEVNTDNSKTVHALMVEEATNTNKESADKMKEFNSLERRKKPANWDSLSATDKLSRSLVNTYAHGKDIFFGLSAPLKVYLRTLEDAGYKPSAEDMAEAFADLIIAGASLGYSTVVKSIETIKKSLELVKSARALGLTGKQFKAFLIKGMAPLMQDAAKSAVTAPITELLPGYGYHDIIKSLGKSTPTLPDLGVVTDLSKKIRAGDSVAASKTAPAGVGYSAELTLTEGHGPQLPAPPAPQAPPLQADMQQEAPQSPSAHQGRHKAAKVVVEVHDTSLDDRKAYKDQAENYLTVKTRNGADMKLTTHETDRNTVHNLVFEAYVNKPGTIYVLTGTQGSPEGTRDDTHKDVASYRTDSEKNGFADNIKIIDISGKTDAEIAEIIAFAKEGDTVIGAFSYSRNDASITKALGIEPLTSHVYPGGVFTPRSGD